MQTNKILSKVVALAIAVFIFGGQSATAKVVALQGSVLHAEDTVRIQVFNQPQLSTDAPIDKEGNLSAPFVGLIKAAGKTPDQLAEELTDKFRKKLFLRDPVVSVTIVSFRQLRATVGGAVQHPGIFAVRPGDTIVNLLNQSGGAIADFSDLRRATLRRSNSKEFIPIDLYALLNRGDLSQNYPVEDGDESTIPEEVRNRIIVLGVVQAPGTYPYHEPMTVADAIALAHGEITYRSRFSKTVVTRQRVGFPGQYTRINVDFVKFVRSGDQSQNIFLQPGDMVYIPQTNTPDFTQVSAIANTFYIINNIGSIFGFRLFR